MYTICNYFTSCHPTFQNPEIFSKIIRENLDTSMIKNLMFEKLYLSLGGCMVVLKNIEIF